MSLRAVVRRRRRRWLVALSSSGAACVAHSVAAAVLAARDPIADGPRSSLLVLGAVLVLACARVFLFFVAPVWTAGELVALFWDARAKG